MSKREQAFENDGLKHYYSTCPLCRRIVPDEDLVFVDGDKMCRGCMTGKQGDDGMVKQKGPR